MTASALALHVEDVSKRFGRTQALDNVSFTVEQGSVHALLGGNGSGKSTLIKILAGVHSANAGVVTVAGETLEATHMTPHRARSAGLRFVHQDLGVFLSLTVAENICLGNGFDKRARCAVSWARVHKRTDALLEEWRIPARAGDVLTSLRPADRTMIAIARASTSLDDRTSTHAGDLPLTLVLDEPTSALPETEVQRLLQWLRESSSQGNTVIFVTHRLEEVLDVATAVTALRDGHHVATRAVAGLTRGDLVGLIAPTAKVGPPPPTAPAGTGASRTTLTAGGDAPRAATSPRLTVRRLTGGSLHDVSFEVAAGEILGIAGLLGSGRTRLLHYLAGVLKPEAGDLLLDGQAFQPWPERRAIAAGVVLVPESRADDGIFPGLSISENLQAASLAVRRPTALALTPRLRTAAKRNAAKFGVKMSSVDDDILTLSGGNQQKVLVGRWLATDPRLVLLDEPSVGVDVDARTSLHALVRTATSNGAAAVCVSSDLYELVDLCDRVLVLREGAVAGAMSGDQLTAGAVGHAMHGSVEGA